MRWSLVLAPWLMVLAVIAPAQEPGKKKPERVLIVLDKDGKEVAVKNWKILQGTRPLPFLIDIPKSIDIGGKKIDLASLARGPEFFELREDKSTTFKDGILTLVPLAVTRDILFDNDKKTISLTFLAPDGKETTLTGTTKYLGINKITLEGEADLGNLGAAEVKFVGGQPKDPKSIQGVRFPQPKSAPSISGPTFTIHDSEKDKSPHIVQDLKALYIANGTYFLSSKLLFKKTVKVDLGQIKHLAHVEPEDKKKVSLDYEVALQDGQQYRLTLIKDQHPEEMKSAFLVGLLGKVPAGFRLFPMHTLSSLYPGEPKEPVKEEPKVELKEEPKN